MQIESVKTKDMCIETFSQFSFIESFSGMHGECNEFLANLLMPFCVVLPMLMLVFIYKITMDYIEDVWKPAKHRTETEKYHK